MEYGLQLYLCRCECFQMENIFIMTTMKRILFTLSLSEVNAGLECGIGMEDYNDWEVGDVLEAFSSIEKKRTPVKVSASMTAEFEGVGMEE
ncbi:hypothetical protein CMV_020234 [Castanea mollissima]|uniref:Uncharacterized protein n=1 Tax=Castanea mollissima TaxID=60419 RepID=A0A8J4QWM6_9ROSI|nr:hypothetical protein CMV_020234 [Castanea mollissima]